jgi:hypothetical protein
MLDPPPRTSLRSIRATTLAAAAICATFADDDKDQVDAMASDVTTSDFKCLETRVDILEREVEGEKLISRHILEQTRRNSDDLAAVKTRLDRVEQKVDGVDRKLEGLVKDLPKIVAETMREVLRERD